MRCDQAAERTTCTRAAARRAEVNICHVAAKTTLAAEVTIRVLGRERGRALVSLTGTLTLVSLPGDAAKMLAAKIPEASS